MTWAVLEKKFPNRFFFFSYRLSVHLTSAITIYALLLYTGLDLYSKRPRALTYLQKYGEKLTSAPSSLRKATLLTAGLTGLTAFSGAYVSGKKMTFFLLFLFECLNFFEK